MNHKHRAFWLTLFVALTAMSMHWLGSETIGWVLVAVAFLCLFVVYPVGEWLDNTKETTQQ